jgi:hypothetical protein
MATADLTKFVLIVRLANRKSQIANREAGIMKIHYDMKEVYEDCPTEDEVLKLLISAGFDDKAGSNDGGLKLFGLIAFVQTLIAVRPRTYVELGAWKGFSAATARHYLPKDASMYIFDIDLSKFNERIIGAKFSQSDWATPSFMAIKKISPSYIFADDHQDVLERIATAWMRGYNYILFDDDYSSSADHRTFRNYILSAYEKDENISKLLNLCVENVVLMSQPKIELPLGADIQWRDKAFVKLRSNTAHGWTAGNPFFADKSNG